MRNVFKSIVVAAFILTSAAPAFAKGGVEVFDIDAVHSTAGFKVRHLGVSNVKGIFDDISGVINLDRANVSKSSVKVVIKTDSVDSNNEKRDEHLKSEDFFDAKNFPEMTFVSTGVKKTGKDTLEVTGDFTLHGVTKRIKVKVEKVGEATDPKAGTRIGYDAEFNIKRSDYGMGKMIPAVGDKVSISLSIEAILKKE